MNQLANPPFPIPMEASDDLIQGYLDVMISRLVGFVPAGERARLRLETQFHLERLREDAIRTGEAPLEAARHAIREYGCPLEIAEMTVDQTFRRQFRSQWIQKLGPANAIAFVVFGLAELACFLLFQYRTFEPVESAFRYAIDPALIPDAIRPFLPIPEVTPVYTGHLLLMIFAPMVAGWIVGRRVPIRASRAAYQGMLPCILYSFVAGLLSLPVQEMLGFALLQIVWWLPTGMAAAYVATLVERDRRVRRWGVA